MMIRQILTSLKGSYLLLCLGYLITLLLWPMHPQITLILLILYFFRMYYTRQPYSMFYALSITIFSLCYQTAHIPIIQNTCPVDTTTPHLLRILPDTLQEQEKTLKITVTDPHQATYTLIIPKDRVPQYWLSTPQYQVTLSCMKNKEKITPKDEAYSHYLTRMHHLGTYQVTQIIPQNNARHLSSSLLFIKHKLRLFRYALKQSFIQKDSYTARYQRTFLLGDLDQDVLMRTWQKNSILALLCLSGFHVQLLITYLHHTLTLIRLPKLYSKGVIWLTLLLFWITSGYALGVTRCLLTYLLKQLDQKNTYTSSLDRLIIALMIHSLFTPHLLLTTGGQFSYGLSMCYLMMPRGWNKLKETLYITLASWPFIWYHFNTWHPMATFYHYVMPIILTYCIFPILFIERISAYTCTYIHDQLIYPCCEWICQQLTYVLSLTAKIIPEWCFGTPPKGLIIIYILYFINLFWRQKKRTLLQMVLLCVLSSILFFYPYLNPVGIVMMLDVGQGDAFLIKTPFHQHTLLIDTGGTFYAQKSADKLIKALQQEGIRTLDLVFITHLDQDHCGHLPYLLEEIPIKQLGFSKGILNTPKGIKFKQQLPKHQSYIELPVHTRIQNHLMTLTVLWPKQVQTGGNEDSLVTYLELKNHHFLLTGDLEKEAEQTFIHDYPNLAVDTLKVAHHGSQYGTTDLFLNAVTPTYGLISVGEHNHYHHPHPDVISRLTQHNVRIYRTDQSGSIYYTYTPWSRSLTGPKTTNKHYP